MKIIKEEFKVKEIYDGYKDDTEMEGGIVGFRGQLNIRPSYQRNFVYNTEQSQAVIYTILQQFPLNLIYFVSDVDSPYKYELLDGQQRIISICKFIDGEFSILKTKNGTESHPVFFHNLTGEEQKIILNYPLSVYICTDGKKDEKIAWFEVINTAGEKLNNQEIKNAIYNGSWVTDAKRYFSKKNCVAYNLGKQYIDKDPNRQLLLEQIIKWISNDDIKGYMAVHQKDENAKELWDYYQNIISWIQKIFPTYRREMKNVDWGILYNKYKESNIDINQINNLVDKLMADPEVEKKNGIYEFVLTGEYKYLNLRQFDDYQKRTMYENQHGECAICRKEFPIEQMHGDHKKPWVKGGKTTIENGQMLCHKCNAEKSAKDYGY